MPYDKHDDLSLVAIVGAVGPKIQIRSAYVNKKSDGYWWWWLCRISTNSPLDFAWI